jgi:hypothetical protein
MTSLNHPKYRVTNSRNSEYYHLKLGFINKSPRINDEIEEHISKEYESIDNKELHLHYHSKGKLPHLHALGCERLIIAFEKQLEQRYYFTNTC